MYYNDHSLFFILERPHLLQDDHFSETLGLERPYDQKVDLALFLPPHGGICFPEMELYSTYIYTCISASL